MQRVKLINSPSLDEPEIVNKPKFVNPLKVEDYLPYFRIDTSIKSEENHNKHFVNDSLAARTVPIANAYWNDGN